MRRPDCNGVVWSQVMAPEAPYQGDRYLPVGDFYENILAEHQGRPWPILPDKQPRAR